MRPFTAIRMSDDVFSPAVASLDYEICDCQVPCAETKYYTEVSYSKFPETGFSNTLTTAEVYNNTKDQR